MTRTDGWRLLPLLLLAASTSHAEDAFRREYEQAAILYEQGEVARAASMFASLCDRNDSRAMVARFALANCRVVEASTAAERARREQLLVEAIRHYRRVLDGAALAPLFEYDDVEHNLLLAKEWLQKAEKLEESPASERARGEKKTSVHEGAGTPRPVLKDPARPPGETSGEVRGPVQTPRSGLAGHDPGPLDRDQATALLRQAIERIEKKREGRIKTTVPLRRAPDDY